MAIIFITGKALLASVPLVNDSASISSHQIFSSHLAGDSQTEVVLNTPQSVKMSLFVCFKWLLTCYLLNCYFLVSTQGTHGTTTDNGGHTESHILISEVWESEAHYS